MPHMYDQDLDKTQANYAPLTPLTFIERAAYVYPNRLSVVHGAQRFTWRETYARCRRLASALARRGDRQERHGRGHGAEHPADVRGAFRRADVRRGAEHAEHPAGCRDDRLHAAPWRGARADHRPRILPGRSAGAGAAGNAAAGHRHRRSRVSRGQTLGEMDLRGVPGRAAIPTSCLARIRRTSGMRSR